MKRSEQIVLWMLGIGLGVAALSEEKTVEQLKQDRYDSREDCLRDWNGDDNYCNPQTTSSGGYTTTHYNGPRYYWDRSENKPVVVTDAGKHVPVDNAHPSGTPLSRSVGSSPAGTVTRGGFGHFGARSGGG